MLFMTLKFNIWNLIMNKNPCISPNCTWQEAWAREAADGIAAYELGVIEAEDFDIAMERLHKQLNRINTNKIELRIK